MAKRPLKLYVATMSVVSVPNVSIIAGVVSHRSLRSRMVYV